MDQTRILAWNCRGLGDTSAISELKKLCFQHKPSIIFLSETKRTAVEMTLIRPDLGLDHVSVCNYAERRGGLTLLWSEESNLQVSSFSPLIDLGLVLLFCRQLCIEKPSHIDVVIVDPGGCQLPSTGGAKRGECRWRLIGDVGGVLQGENATSVSKGVLVPLLKFGNKGLQRIAIVRAWLRAHGDKEGAWVCMEVPGFVWSPIFALTAIVVTIFSLRWPSSLNCPYMSWAQFKSITNAVSYASILNSAIMP
ncbi:hypothetical protein SLEP1_g24877 [Rubroshorea leprosula]|uniref:Endonuclease/exonuclease/phosphatase domain-containing protein n=1 Tax=Rubroshorea leprosula TaxID=152421 RepID=A0AAV5JN87_9ROSI|nr:hypothetical protein SLEP1_g24877 [Rubroshorea leprosula]